MTETHRSKSRSRRDKRGVAIIVLLSLLGIVTFHRPLFLGNLGEVCQGQVYRSAQPQNGLEKLIQSKHLSSILNLRGGSQGDSWYAHEVELTKANGIDFYDLPMSATSRPGRRQLLILLDLFKHCRYPLLIHCKSGSDRTGLASALYLMTMNQLDPDSALSAFSLTYGHVPIGGPQRLHEPLLEYRDWLLKEHVAHTPEIFHDWVEREYRSDDDVNISVEPLQPGPRERAVISPSKPASASRQD